MSTQNTKTLLSMAWLIAVLLAAIAIGITSVANWLVVAGVAIVPPVIARVFWRAPEQTLSESIQDVRR